MVPSTGLTGGHLDHNSESGRQDLNLRPFGPEPNALAKLSYAPSDKIILATCPTLSTSSGHADPGRCSRLERFGHAVASDLAEESDCTSRPAGVVCVIAPDESAICRTGLDHHGVAP
jgi:hypothetical protein